MSEQPKPQRVTPHPGDKRVELAVDHADSWVHFQTKVLPDIAPDMVKKKYDLRKEKFWSFLAGFDAAMELHHDELINENRELQGRVMDLEFGCIDWIPDAPPYDQIIRFDPIELGM